ncbi:MAG: A/G-specific adenine glycosylase [Lachnospiraceae bacterium]|nr:A/G-specific adenine glycosylase [Lachnospiraceae bacterium]
MDPQELREHKEEFLRVLNAWFIAEHRDLPWRDLDAPNPYHVWISEIMLQQTRVSAVVDYFLRFISELPDIAALASVPDDRLMKLWEGLGYYSRARNLKRCAQVLMHDFDGAMPRDPAALAKLPGIGPYTAGAIASIAFGEPKAAVDGNVLRVFSRLLADRSDISKESTKKAYTELLDELLPYAHNAGHINQAIMDLGATICIPGGEARCSLCPVEGFCKARREGITGELPVKQRAQSRRQEHRVILILENGGKVLVGKRPEQGLLAGLYEYPGARITPKQMEDFEQGPSGKRALKAYESLFGEFGLTAKKARFALRSKHIFSHIEWEMIGLYVETADPCATEALAEKNLYFADAGELKERYALPGAFSAYTNEFLNRRGDIDGSHET